VSASAKTADDTSTATVRLTQRGFLKALAIAGTVGVAEAALAPNAAEAAYTPGTGGNPDSINNNLLISGNVVIGSTYTATSVLGITQSMSGVSGLAGLVNSPSLTFTTTGANVRGLLTRPTVVINSGVTLTNLYHLQVDASQVTVNGSLTNEYGVYVGVVNHGGTNAYSVYVNPPSGATNNYALYVAGGTSYLGGSLQVGATTPSASPPALLSVGTTSQFQVTAAGVVTAPGLTLSPGFTVNGGVLYTNGSGVVAQVASAGANGQALVSAGGGSPSWFAPTTGSVLFAGASGALSQDNGHLFWDSGDKWLGIGTSSPATTLDVAGGIRAAGQATPTSGAGLELSYSGGVAYLTAIDHSTTYKQLSIDGLPLALNALSGGNVGIGTTSPTANALLDVNGIISASGSALITSTPPSVSTNVGWKLGLYGNQYAIGIANFTLAAATPAWLSVFNPGIPPANNASSGLPDANAKVTLGADGTVRPAYGLLVTRDVNGTTPARPDQIVLQGATKTNLRLYVGLDTTNECAIVQSVNDGVAWRNIAFVRDGGNVGIGITNPGTSSPSARLSIVGAGASELVGTAASGLLRTQAGSLTSTQWNELALTSIGFGSNNNSSLGLRAVRTIANGSDWTTTAIGLGMDVDSTVRAGPSLWLAGNGNVGIGSGTYQGPFLPLAALHLNLGNTGNTGFQINNTKIADSTGCYYA
jgi:hypothetical protein